MLSFSPSSYSPETMVPVNGAALYVVFSTLTVTVPTVVPELYLVSPVLMVFPASGTALISATALSRAALISDSVVAALIASLPDFSAASSLAMPASSYLLFSQALNADSTTAIAAFFSLVIASSSSVSNIRW